MHYRLMDIYYILNYNLILLYFAASITLFCYSDDSSFVHWKLFQLVLMSFNKPHRNCCFISKHFIILWHCKSFQAHLVYFTVPPLSFLKNKRVLNCTDKFTPHPLLPPLLSTGNHFPEVDIFTLHVMYSQAINSDFCEFKKLTWINYYAFTSSTCFLLHHDGNN